MTSKRKKPPADLLFADSERSADQLYFGQFFAPDPFLSLRIGRKKIAVLNALEYARGRKESAFDEILHLGDCTVRAGKRFKVARPDIPEVAATVLRERGVSRCRVPDDFPVGLADKLRALGLKVESVDGEFFPARQIKTDAEAAAIREGNACSAAGFRAAEAMLREATIRNGRLRYRNRPLTSERVKEAIEIACLQRGAVSSHTIVAGGDQACDPHCTGSGPLRANDLILVDIFPRVTATGYHGDMTRTFLKGRASEAQRQLVETVRQAHRLAIKTIKAGVTGDTVHRRVVEFFTSRNYATTMTDRESSGFFHGTGHGLGLDVHEAPRVSIRGPRLRQGHVVTVEPGLYYPGLGGARVEDVVRVTTTKAERLSSYPYRWELT